MGRHRVLGSVLGFAATACSLTSLDGFTSEPVAIPAPSDGGPAVDADADAAVEAPVPASTYSGAVLADAPAGYWRFEEATGTTVRDEITGAASPALGGCTLGVPSASNLGRGIRFDGSSCAIDLGDRFPFKARAPFTVEMWIQREPRSAYQILFNREVRGPADPIHGYGLLVDDTGKTYFERVSNGMNDGTPRVILRSGAFRHVVATYDGTNMRLYLDGVLGATEPDGEPIAENAAHAVLGVLENRSTGWYLGIMDEVAVYPKALSAERIAAHHALGSGE